MTYTPTRPFLVSRFLPDPRDVRPPVLVRRVAGVRPVRPGRRVIKTAVLPKGQTSARERDARGFKVTPATAVSPCNLTSRRNRGKTDSGYNILR